MKREEARSRITRRIAPVNHPEPKQAWDAAQRVLARQQKHSAQIYTKIVGNMLYSIVIKKMGKF